MKLSMNASLSADIRARLAAFPFKRSAVDDAHHAAVAIVLVDEGFGADLPGLPAHGEWQAQPALLLTRRAASLRKHAGQWAFPGGRLDPGETPVQTALRELEEEVGVRLGDQQVLGCLDDFVTRSGFVMTPVVVWGGSVREASPNPDEVASIHRIPLTELLRSDAPLLSDQNTSAHPVLRMPVGDDHIAAPTAALLYQFREVCLLERHTRVAHYEQPRFAWR
ncbi:MAG: CoA pyrophosphatase [Pseudomonadales bacterium]|nr:CoA pyrophosphatase [Pseudomonadales bacterium]